MNYISVKEASDKWGISERRVRILCSENRIDGVTKSSWAWNIPSDAPKPSDGRTIRHVKNIDLKVSGINFTPLIDKNNLFNKIVDKPNKYKKYFDDSITRFLLMALSEEYFDNNQIIEVLNNNPSNLLFKDQMLILNSKSIIVDFFKQTGFGPILANNTITYPFLSEKKLRKINDDLYRGFDDYHISKYQDQLVINPSSYEKKSYDVSMQIETLIYQYEMDWKNLNPLVRASFMFAQLLRIQPFEKHNFLFSSLIFAAILLEAKYPLAIIPYDLIDELKANLSLTLSKGNYTNLIKMLYSSLINELDKLITLS